MEPCEEQRMVLRRQIIMHRKFASQLWRLKYLMSDSMRWGSMSIQLIQPSAISILKSHKLSVLTFVFQNRLITGEKCANLFLKVHWCEVRVPSTS